MRIDLICFPINLGNSKFKKKLFIYKTYINETMYKLSVDEKEKVWVWGLGLNGLCVYNNRPLI